jgi:hypothetical protein
MWPETATLKMNKFGGGFGWNVASQRSTQFLYRRRAFRLCCTDGIQTLCLDARTVSPRKRTSRVKIFWHKKKTWRGCMFLILVWYPVISSHFSCTCTFFKLGSCWRKHCVICCSTINPHLTKYPDISSNNPTTRFSPNYIVYRTIATLVLHLIHQVGHAAFVSCKWVSYVLTVWPVSVPYLYLVAAGHFQETMWVGHRIVHKNHTAWKGHYHQKCKFNQI